MHSIYRYQGRLPLLQKDRASFSRVTLLSLFAMSLLFPATLYAQYRTSIQGVVTDSTGAVIPGATLTLTNNGTAKSRSEPAMRAAFTTSTRCRPITSTWPSPRTDSRRRIFNELQLIPEQPNSVNVQLTVGRRLKR